MTNDSGGFSYVKTVFTYPTEVIDSGTKTTSA